MVATLKAVATSECASALVVLEERCGAAGMFSANRFIEFWTQTQGLITAEGDNQLMLLKVGCSARRDPSPPVTAHATWAHPAPLSPSLCLALLRFREQRPQEELAINASARRATDLVRGVERQGKPRDGGRRAYGDSMIAGRFIAAVEDARDSTRNALATLCALWALGRIERHARSVPGRRALTATTVKELGRIRDDLCAETEPHTQQRWRRHSTSTMTCSKSRSLEPDYVQAYRRCFNRQVTPGEALADTTSLPTSTYVRRSTLKLGTKRKHSSRTLNALTRSRSLKGLSARACR